MPRRSILPSLSAAFLVEHLLAFKKKLILPYTTTDTHVNLEDMTLSEINQLQKDKYCMIHSSEEAKLVSHRMEEGSGDCQEGGGDGELLVIRHKVSVK